MIVDAPHHLLSVPTLEDSETFHIPTSPYTWTDEVGTYGLSSWQIQAINRIIDLRNLPDDWDSYGSSALSTAIINKSIELILALPPEDFPVPAVIPTSDEGVQFEWGDENKELEIEVNKNGEIEYLKCENGEPVQEGLIEGSDQLFSLVFWVNSV